MKRVKRAWGRAGMVVAGGLMVVMGSACGAAEAVRPDAPTAAEATGAKCDPDAQTTNVYVVDLPVETRSDLQLALDASQLAVVSFTCDKLKILKTCRASGTYTFRGTSAKERVLSLENSDQIRAALPLGGAGIAATFESEAATGTKFDLGLVIAGQMIGSASSFTSAELTGDCGEATHVIIGGKMGAFAMGTSAKAELKTAAEVFGAGASAGSTSSKIAKTRDGSIKACDDAERGNDTPPKNCDAVLALELSKLTRGYPLLEIDELSALLFDLWYSDELCKEMSACEQVCNTAKGKGCKELGLSLIAGETSERKKLQKNIPRGVELLRKACKLDDMRGCAALSSMLIYAKQYDDALAPAEKACNVARDVDGCSNVGEALAGKGDKEGALKAYEKACDIASKPTSFPCTQYEKFKGE